MSGGGGGEEWWKPGKGTKLGNNIKLIASGTTSARFQPMAFLIKITFVDNR